MQLAHPGTEAKGPEVFTLCCDPGKASEADLLGSVLKSGRKIKTHFLLAIINQQIISNLSQYSRSSFQSDTLIKDQVLLPEPDLSVALTHVNR